MTREEIITCYSEAVYSTGLAAAAGNESAARDFELLKAGLDALLGPTRKQVEKMRGEWKPYVPRALGAEDAQYRCAGCGLTADAKAPFCPQCGAPMTDEAVDILVKRLEEMQND